MEKKLIILGVIALIAVGAVFALTDQIFETNQSGFYQVKQAAVTGEMSVINEPGTYSKMFGTINTYQVSDMYYFSKYDEDGGSGIDAAPVKVRFNDGGTAEISGSIKFKLSQKSERQLMLHMDYKSYRVVKKDLVRQVVTEALMQTATLMKAEESYSTRRSEYTTLTEGQIRDGIYMTESLEYEAEDVQGKKFIAREVKVKYNKAGKPIVRKDSPFKRYDIEILQFVIKDIDFDSTIDNLISQKKKAEQQKVVAKANAEKAKQDAITAAEQGKARIAIAKANEDVEKIKAVTNALKDKEVALLQANKEKSVALLQAEKDKAVALLQAEKAFKVAEFETKQANERAKKIIAVGRAESEANKLKVQAGLTPQEQAEWKYKTAVGIAANLSQVKVPGIVISGGGNGKAGASPLDVIGVNMLLDIQEKMKKVQ